MKVSLHFHEKFPMLTLTAAKVVNGKLVTRSVTVSSHHMKQADDPFEFLKRCATEVINNLDESKNG